MTEQLRNMAAEIARERGIPVNVFQAMIQRESGYDIYAVNGSHYGLGQLSPAAIKDVGGNLSKVYDPHENLSMAADYLKLMYGKTGDWYSALAAYNQGYGGWLQGLGTDYAASVYKIAGLDPEKTEETGYDKGAITAAGDAGYAKGAGDGSGSGSGSESGEDEGGGMFGNMFGSAAETVGTNIMLFVIALLLLIGALWTFTSPEMRARALGAIAK